MVRCEGNRAACCPRSCTAHTPQYLCMCCSTPVPLHRLHLFLISARKPAPQAARRARARQQRLCAITTPAMTARLRRSPPTCTLRPRRPRSASCRTACSGPVLSATSRSRRAPMQALCTAGQAGRSGDRWLWAGEAEQARPAPVCWRAFCRGGFARCVLAEYSAAHLCEVLLTPSRARRRCSCWTTRALRGLRPRLRARCQPGAPCCWTTTRRRPSTWRALICQATCTSASTSAAPGPCSRWTTSSRRCGGCITKLRGLIPCRGQAPMLVRASSAQACGKPGAGACARLPG